MAERFQPVLFLLLQRGIMQLCVNHLKALFKPVQPIFPCRCGPATHEATVSNASHPKYTEFTVSGLMLMALNLYLSPAHA